MPFEGYIDSNSAMHDKIKDVESMLMRKLNAIEIAVTGQITEVKESLSFPRQGMPSTSAPDTPAPDTPAPDVEATSPMKRKVMVKKKMVKRPVVPKADGVAGEASALPTPEP